MTERVLDYLRPAVSARADVLLAEDRLALHRRTDRLFVWVMLVQWVAGIAAALWWSPRTWSGSASQVHVHVYAAVFLGAAIAGLPILLAWARPGAASTRQVIAAAQVLFSSLLIHLSGGRIETHFHVFGSLAFLAAYRDWRVLVTASVVVAVDHALRGMFWPASVYGVLAPDGWRWVEHVGWVIFEDVFLAIAIRQSNAEMRAGAARQAEVEAAREQLEAVTRSKDAFLAHVSHEIRTPMTAILGYAELMSAEGQPAEERREAARTIRRNGEHLLAILNDILDMSKIEAGKLSVERVPCSPVGVVEGVVELMRPRAVEKGVRLVVEYTTAVPRTVRTDPTRLRQVLLNLLSNAVKFTERGEVRLVVSAGVDELRFEVADTGIGMTPEQIAGLFEPFRQGDDSTSRRFGGTGLGLSISKRLVELLGGRIEVASHAGAGSTFVVTLKVETAGAAMIRPEVAALLDKVEGVTPSVVGLALPPADPLRARVLLADDAPDNRRLLQRILERSGVALDLAENGRVAVERALAGRYDVVLMDMQMPEMDGYEAVARLRQTGYRRPIVALTAHASATDRERCLAAGCDEYLSKPFDVRELLAVIGRLNRGTPVRVGS